MIFDRSKDEMPQKGTQNSTHSKIKQLGFKALFLLIRKCYLAWPSTYTVQSARQK